MSASWPGRGLNVALDVALNARPPEGGYGAKVGPQAIWTSEWPCPHLAHLFSPRQEEMVL